MFIPPWSIPAWFGHIIILIGLIVSLWFLFALRDPEQGFERVLVAAIVASMCLGFGTYISLVHLGV